jgi:hypothetical protein
MTTIKDQLLTIDNEYIKKLAIVNAKDGPKYTEPMTEYSSEAYALRAAIYTAFDWEASPEGCSFWNNIDEQLANGKPLVIPAGHMKTIADSVHHFVMFSLNYPHNFVELIDWTIKTSHIRSKFNNCYEKAGTTGVMISFYSELSIDNQARLTEFITLKYKG